MKSPRALPLASARRIRAAEIAAARKAIEAALEKKRARHGRPPKGTGEHQALPSSAARTDP